MPYFPKQKTAKSKIQGKIDTKKEVMEIINYLKKHGVAQPIRTQPTKGVMRAKNLLDYLARLTYNDVKRWGDFLIADMKYQGVRGLIVILPKEKKVYVFSRNFKRLYKFEDEYADEIFKDLANWVDEPTIIDTELYAVDKNGNPLPQPIETGWAKNPEGYPELRANIRAFDVLVADGKDVRNMALEKRKEILQKLLDYEGGVVFLAESRKIKNKPSNLVRLLKEALQTKTEGLVIKDPKSPYFYGKIQNPELNPWRKVKLFDTIDLRLRRVSIYPENKEFVWFYKHWYLSPENRPTHETEADKGIRNAKLNHEFYAKFTKEILKLWKEGKAKASGKMFKIDPNKTVVIDGKRVRLIDYYGTDKIPENIILEKDERPIVEVYVEQITPDLKLSGVKIVGIREDKDKADTLGTLKRLYRLYYELPPSRKNARKYVMEVFQTSMDTKTIVNRLLNAERPDLVFKEAYNLGMLQTILPEVAEKKTVTQRSIFHPEATVFGHTMSMLRDSEKYRDIFKPKEFETLRLAILLHDIGKTNDIKKIDKKGRSWFPGHDKKSVEMAKKVLRRLGYDEQTQKDVLWIIKNHMIFNKYLRMPKEEKKKLLSHRLFPLLYAHYTLDGLNILDKPKVIQKIALEYPQLTKSYNDEIAEIYASMKDKLKGIAHVVAVVGNREKYFKDPEKAKRLFFKYMRKVKPEMIVSGGSPGGGVDIWAKEFAKKYKIPFVEFAPFKNTIDEFMKRNKYIAGIANEMYAFFAERKRNSGTQRTMDYFLQFANDNNLHTIVIDSLSQMMKEVS